MLMADVLAGRAARRSCLADFLEFLATAGRTPRSLPDRLPPHRHVRHESEPHLWTADEIRRVLAVIDRQSAAGKRDYAMILATARLGPGYPDGSITKEAVDGFLYGRHLRSSTVRRNELALRQLAGHAQAFGWDACTPAAATRVRVRHQPPYVLTDDEDGPVGIIDTEARWRHARRLLHYNILKPEDRVAGLLLLYARGPASPSTTSTKTASTCGSGSATSPSCCPGHSPHSSSSSLPPAADTPH